jgi:hypothetical protein
MQIKTLSLALILTCNIALADREYTQIENMPDFNQTGSWIVMPYLFSTEMTGLAGGIGAIAQGLLQPQTTFVGTLFYGVGQDVVNNGTADTINFSGGLFSYSNVKVPFTSRTYFSTWGYMMHIPKDTIYLNGTADSKEKDGLVTSGQDDYFSIILDYVLPLGEGVDNPDGTYTLKDGFAVGREEYGNGTPFVTGRSTIGIKTFYEHYEIENWKGTAPWNSSGKAPSWDDSGLRFYLLHDNTDFDLNPSRGYSFQFQYSKDFGWGDSLQSWDDIEVKYSKYFNLETFSFTKQNVLALNFWTAYSPSWDKSREILPEIDAHRPPPWEGPKLGGFIRMRGYTGSRFSDKAAIYGAAEYRAILDWNPFKTEKFLRENTPVAIDWFQIVPFVEMGSVNDSYDFDLLSNLKFDAGIGIRAMAAELPVRLDIGVSDEGVNMWVMIHHPFDF